MIDVDAYLARIGAARPAAPDLAALRELHARHLSRVPFENLSIHLGERIELDEGAVVAKLLRGRGGFCYELNGAFAALLTALGFRVSLLSARVYGDGDVLSPPFDHLALLVELDGPWLADVGFGQFTTHPLRLDVFEPQSDPQGEFLVTEVAPGLLDVRANGTLEYRLELRPRRLAEFGPRCHYQQTSPESHFTRSVTCSLPTPAGRVTLAGDRLIRTEHGQRTETRVAAPELLDTYRAEFGIRLDRAPVVP